MKKTIDLNKLPKSVLNQIPITLRLSKNVHYLHELPTPIQYLVYPYVTDLNLTNSVTADVFDILPEVSIYNDFELVNDQVSLILTFFSNYLSTLIGSYPFDVNFGCLLKQQLQTRDTALRQTLISNEVYLIADVLANDYDLNIRIVNIEINRTEKETDVEYYIRIKLEIKDKTYTLEVN